MICLTCEQCTNPKIVRHGFICEALNLLKDALGEVRNSDAESILLDCLHSLDRASLDCAIAALGIVGSRDSLERLEALGNRAIFDYDLRVPTEDVIIGAVCEIGDESSLPWLEMIKPRVQTNAELDLINQTIDRVKSSA